MKIELKNIKVHLNLSQETHAYTAMLYVDGKKAVEVSNQGHGGGDYQHPVNGYSVEKINDWCIATLPKWQLFDDEMYDTDLEMWCHDQVNDHLTLKDMKRKMRSKALFVDAGKVWEMGLKGLKKYEPRMGEAVRQQYPEAVILNDLPVIEALAIYRAETSA
tara:strand:+ start:72 stop:554 length:483 start_codon:yes stop_codon:yes gene_type:complete